MIETARAGEAGLGFSVVANEVKAVPAQVEQVARALDAPGRRMVRELRGQRLADLAAHAIKVMGRNLCERTCDVRWRAADGAVVRGGRPAMPTAGHQAARSAAPGAAQDAASATAIPPKAKVRARARRQAPVASSATPYSLARGTASAPTR